MTTVKTVNPSKVNCVECVFRLLRTYSPLLLASVLSIFVMLCSDHMRSVMDRKVMQ